MPLGQYGYEPFPEEEPEPEREESRFNVVSVGLWLLILAAVGTIGAFIISTQTPAK